MTKVIKNGTIVTADLTYTADIRVEGGKITEIGPNLSGGETLDASGCYVMPGGIDPHTHLEMPFMGTYSADDFESGTRAGLAGGTTMVVPPDSAARVPLSKSSVEYVPMNGISRCVCGSMPPGMM